MLSLWLGLTFNMTSSKGQHDVMFLDQKLFEYSALTVSFTRGRQTRWYLYFIPCYIYYLYISWNLIHIFSFLPVNSCEFQHPCVQTTALQTQIWFHLSSVNIHFIFWIILLLLSLFLEKRPSLGSSFSSFQIPTQRDPGLRLRRRSGSEDQDEESKENVDSRAGCDLEKRHSHASNGDMDIP